MRTGEPVELRRERKGIKRRRWGGGMKKSPGMRMRKALLPEVQGVMERERGPLGLMEDVGEGLGSGLSFLSRLPGLLLPSPLFLGTENVEGIEKMGFCFTCVGGF